MTQKHDYQHTLLQLNSLLHGKEADEHVLGIILSDNWDAVLHALKLATIVTGEPSEGMTMAGCEAWKKHPMAVVTQFKAMIAEAQREAEGERLESTVQHNTKYEG